MSKKIKSVDEIGQIAGELKEKGKKIVTTNGAFDLLHAGHIRNLQFCKAQGDVLIVGLNSDSSIKKYKSEKRPIIPQRQRAEVLAALESVDYVVIFPETTPLNLLKIIKPDVHVKGSEYKKGLIEQDIIEKNNGKIVFFEKDPKGLSTSKIIEKIKGVYK